MPLDPEVKEITTLLATLGAQLAATNQRLDTLFEQVASIGALLRDQDGLLMRVDRLEIMIKPLESLPVRVLELENWKRTDGEREREVREASKGIKERLFYPLVVALVLALLGLLWALITHQATIGPAAPAHPVVPFLVWVVAAGASPVAAERTASLPRMVIFERLSPA